MADDIKAFVTSKALLAAVVYRIPDILAAHGPLTVSDICSKSEPPISPSQTEPLLQLLCSLGIFTLDITSSTFANSPASTLLTRFHWTQWYRWVSVYPGPFYELFTHLPSALPESESRSALQIARGAVADTPTYALLGKEPWYADLQGMMAAGATAQAPGMLKDYDWGDMAKGGRDSAVCDLGGGDGTFMAALLGANEGMYGAVMELERMANVAKEKIFGENGRLAGVKERMIDIHAGDFFNEVPSYSNYVIRWTLHNWGDVDAEKILKKIRGALINREGSRLCIVESVLADGGGGRLGRPALYGSIVMAVGGKGGMERTEKQWEALAEHAGWMVAGIYGLRNCIPSIIDLRPA
ncbi:S-adenosyl-L-methionine-dependent methyltransferase [Viridothelium virens]|uniref:S-adenosyl-L-methionine-dependent methyltransferase n=1 Tax=Viridothelium virens TaxID=1048519 RepID=A0A6A6HB21_VIRVR|nr:S-adenosyl-L-methionine-dependent methyltransferase [Viridothelium virens]